MKGKPAAAVLLCVYSRGVLAFICFRGCWGSDNVYKGYHKHSASKFVMHSDVARALPLARASLAARSKYGQFVFSLLCENGAKMVEVAKDEIQSAALVRMAAAQGLDAALLKLAIFYGRGTGDIAQGDQESLRLLLLSANQGYLPDFLQAGNHYEWLAGNFYQKAADGGNRQAKNQVRMIDSMSCGPPLNFDDDDDDDDDDYDGVDWTDGDGDDDDSEDEDDA
jgi:hypothetical protein